MRKVFTPFLLLFFLCGTTTLLAQDFDGDGVVDSVDVDDDNDGLLDVVEVPNLACDDFPQLNFSNDKISLVSGTDLSVGAVYKYDNVGLGIDALVTIVSMDSNDALLVFDDNTTESGSDTFFAPVLRGGAARRVEFRIDFVEGSDNSIPRVFPNFIIVATDIDGSEDGVEFQEYTRSLVYAIDNNPSGSSSTELTVTEGPSSIRFDGSTTTYSPTSLENTQVMAGLRYSSLSSFNYVIGTTGDINDRYFSISFDPCDIVTYFGEPSANLFVDFLDSDEDGLLDSQDLDSDNDGIPDNVEAQSTFGFVELNNDASGTYTSNNGLNSAYVATGGITPQNSDGDAFEDFRDTDSDNDAVFDAEENGMAANSPGTFTDADNDGIDDDFDAIDNTASWNVSGYITNGNLWQMQVLLGDSDGDTYLSTVLTNDVDYRDNVDNPRTTIDFDGVDDCVVTESPLVFGNGNTIMGWFLADPSLSGNVSIAGQRNHNISLNATTGVLRSNIIAKDDAGQEVSFSSNTDVSGLVTKGVWQHFASVVDVDARTMKLYLNGEEIDERAIDSARDMADVTVGGGHFLIGRNYDLDLLPANAELFGGSIYEIKAFNAALTQQQVGAQIFQEVEQNTATGNLIGAIVPLDIEGNVWSDLEFYYRMDEVIDSKASDKAMKNRGQLLNVSTAQPRTAPLPLVAKNGGMWHDASTWLNGQDVVDALAFIDSEYAIVQLEGNDLLRVPSTKYTLDRSVNIFGLLISISAELEVAEDSGLDVRRYLDLNGLIDLEGESQLIQGPNSVLNERSTGTLERDQQGTKDQYTYNYWSSPVGETSTSSNNTNYQIQNVLHDGSTGVAEDITWTFDGDVTPTTPITLSTRWIYRFVNGTADDYFSWVYTGNTGIVEAGQGYSMKGPDFGLGAEQNYVFIGKPNNGDITLNIDTGNQYLVGNPYASALDATQFIQDNAGVIDGTLEFWDHFGGGTHVTVGYQGGYAYRNEMDGTPAIAWNGAGTPSNKVPSQYIPVSQGFFVEAAAGGTIEFNNGQRTFQKESDGSSLFFRAAPDGVSGGKATKEKPADRPSTTADERMKLRISMTSESGYTRQLLLGFDDSATDDMDYGLDSDLGDENNDDFYWVVGDNKLVIQSLQRFRRRLETPLGVNSSQEGTVTFKLDELINFLPKAGVYLRDKEAETVTNLRETDYEVTVPQGTTLDRFSIIFHPKGFTPQDISAKKSIDIIANRSGSEIMIVNPENVTVKSIRVLDIYGQVVKKAKIASTDSHISIPMNIRSGVYVVRVNTEFGRRTKKVMIR